MPVAQVINSTFYFFVPRPLKSRWMFEDGAEHAKGLFQHVFKLAWNAYTEGGPEKERVPITSLEEYTAHCIGESEKIKKRVQDEILELEKEAEQALTAYREALRGLHIAQQTKDFAFRFVDERCNSESLKEEWIRITRIPDVKKIYGVDDGMQLETTAIVCEHNGEKYDMGSLIVRHEFKGPFRVWGLEPTHPRCIAHPHLNPRTGVCFGNATAAIENAACDVRRADGLEMVMRWLKEGYDPDLADIKIEEWPLYQHKEEE